jgi:hypothetical protein
MAATNSSPALPIMRDRTTGVLEASTSPWVVLLDGVRHACEIPDDEPPRPGTRLMVGDEPARVDYIATSEDGRPIISATRIG